MPQITPFRFLRRFGLPDPRWGAVNTDLADYLERRDRELEQWLDDTGRRNGVAVRRANALSIPNAAATTVTYDTEDSDLFAMHASGVFTIPSGQSGLWIITAYHTMAAVIVARHFIEINSTAIPGPADLFRANGYGEDSAATCAVVPFAAGDTFTIKCFQVSGAAVNLTNGWCSAYRWSP